MLFFTLTSVLAAVSFVIALPNFGNITCGSYLSREDVAQAEASFAKEKASLAANQVTSSITGRALIPINVPVYFQVVHENNTPEGGYVSRIQIIQQIDVLNIAFSPAGITWFLAGIIRTQNSKWFRNAKPFSQDEANMRRKLRRGDAGALNIYSLGLQSSGYMGYGTFPANVSTHPELDGIFVPFSTLPGGSMEHYNTGRVAVHEAGHWVGLYHTFEGGCDGPGDFVSDTPAQGSDSWGCTVIRDTCPGPGVDPTTNFMDYGPDVCRKEFTPGQVARMRSQLATFRRLPRFVKAS